ncbi:VTT domain-containing protein [Brevibacillus ruminantium]|uniref:TVP38/TMEM64 family membrane protein n=1 Tax=Brevibacillus ruminantium TaxID=2950604 RepID=A0ABY4W873_9BACL|nr:VTT domain-containing protein [Brevibacillus ruminantium]USG63373.1 VTT domain-containing protein [Brevibacillus ruminantium]
MNVSDLVVTTAEWIRSWGIFAIIASLLINVLISVAGVLPSLFLSAANAVVFGLWGGFLISLTGEILGAVVSFLLYRWGISRSEKLQKVGETRLLRRLAEMSRARRLLTLILLRVNPLIPSGVVNVGASFSKIPFADFFLATVIGKTPSLVMETFIGHDLVFLAENKLRLLIAILLAASVFLLFKWTEKKEVA